MPKVEIDEAEWAAQQTITKLFGDMLNNPVTREQVLKAKKAVRPNEPIPEIDAADRGYAAIDKLSKEFTDFRTSLEKQQADREAAEKAHAFQNGWERSKQTLREDGWMDDGIANIEKLANDRGIPDLEAAAALYSKLHPKPEPVQPSGYGRFNMFEMPEQADQDSFMKKLIETRGDGDGAIDGEIRSAINDVRGAPRR